MSMADTSAADAPSGCGFEAATDEDFHALLGTRVTLHGLKAKPELNGTRGRVMSFDFHTNRAGVKIAGKGEMLSIKPANLLADADDEEPKEQVAVADGAPAASPGHEQRGFTELALDNNVQSLRRLLECKADVDQRDGAGNTALICAAFAGHDACVRVLLAAHASIDAATPKGFTPLMAARARGHSECVALLEHAQKFADIMIEPSGVPPPSPPASDVSDATPSSSTTAATATTAATTSSTRLAIVSMMKRPPNLFTWLHYHTERAGVTRFYLRIEDTPELEVDLNLPPWSTSVHATFASSAAADVDAQMSRQQAFVDSSVATARADGVTHLLHIDDDELLYCHSGSAALHALLSNASPAVLDLHCHNLEALHPADESDDPFLHACAFRHRRLDYGAYSNGKSIGVVAHPTLKSNGVHHFATLQTDVMHLPPSAAAILHFESATYSRWIAKLMPFVQEHLRRATISDDDQDQLATDLAAASTSESAPAAATATAAAAAACPATSEPIAATSPSSPAITLPPPGTQINLGSIWRFPWYQRSVQVLLDLLCVTAVAGSAHAGSGHSGAAEAEARAEAKARAEAAAKAHWAAWRRMPAHIDVQAALRARRQAWPDAPPCCHLEAEGITLLWPFGPPS